MKLEELEIYNLSMELGDKVWHMVSQWEEFSRDTIGKPLVTNVDAIAAHISEGFGQSSSKQMRYSAINARGLLFKMKTFITKAQNRYLINESEFEVIKGTVNKIGAGLNAYIKTLGEETQQQDKPYKKNYDKNYDKNYVQR